MKLNNTMLVVIVLVALAAGGAGGYFFRNYQLTKLRGNIGMMGANGNFQRFTGTRGGAQNGMMGRGGVFGSILSMDDKSITVKLTDGSSKIVLFSDATTYANTVNAAKTDLKVGENVAVMGATNSDGSVTATNVQINPEFGRPQGSPTPASK